MSNRLKGRIFSQSQIEKLRKAGKNRKHSDDTRKKMSISAKKRPPTFTGKKHTLKAIKKMSGENNHNWKGGIYPINRKIRKSTEYKLWRKSVFERDKYTCRFCKEKGGELQADHIKPLAYFPELRFAIDNGRTLCKDCHRKTDTYGRKQ